MGMDVDFVVAKQQIDELREILSKLPHGERSEICDDIVDFVKEMKEKYEKVN